jgi:hypothetical protein
MSKQASATLLPKTKERKAATKKTVLVITLFKRPDSKFWQAKVRDGKGKPKRLTTRTLSPQAAAEFAELLYRHEARQKRATPPRNLPATCELF